MSDIGFIGLGIMGAPMCRNLLKAGHKVVAYNRSPEPINRIVQFGAVRGASPRDVAEQSKIVITMLPDGPQVEEVVLGPGGVLEGAQPGSTIIDMSSVNPLVSQKLAASCEAISVRFLDAPVSGGEPKAVDGTLAIMSGGDEAAFMEVKPILQLMGSTVTLTGPVGAGNITKLANQIIVACNIAAMGEALVLATRAGLNPRIVLDAIKGGLAGSAVLNAKAPMVIDRNFNPGSMKVGLPLTSAVQQMLIALMNEGKGDLDHAAIVTFIEAMAGVEVKPK
jgi:2-hydroxy-3-oxopropionate reductase